MGDKVYFMTKTIILGMPKSRNIYLQIKKNLEFYGFEVLYIDNYPEYIKHFHYQSFKDYLYNLVQKLFFRNYSYKTKLKEKLLLSNAEQALNKRNYEYAIIIRPDLYPISLLNLMKAHTKNEFIAYQWDGLRRMPCTKETINLFDKFYVFDSYDIVDNNYQNYKLEGITNFYFDMNKPQPIKHKGTIAYFVGTENEIDFSQNIEMLNEIDIIVDFVNPLHNGLSFRIFEALYYQKKLITNNVNVSNYDFYHPDNILIWHKDDLSQKIKEFLSKPFRPINPEIVKKYGFNNWIRNILNLPPYKKINLSD